MQDHTQDRQTARDLTTAMAAFDALTAWPDLRCWRPGET